ncbi:MAG: DoxX family protein [bacterium]|nr:DoxX family protein [Gammaproteobacteria bacterium]HIL96202.1 DoxX family protein [Pseudomonadales bacterium]
MPPIVENACLLAGRVLMGVYFILPAISKITDFEGTSEYMAVHNVPLIPVLLVITIIIQLSASGALIVGFKGKYAALLLAGLTIVISVFMHNFWDYEEGLERAHELQNFYKNMGIIAGLLVVAGLGTGGFSVDNRAVD